MRGVDVSTVAASSVVPLTLGPSRDKAQERCLVVVAWTGTQEQVARGLLARVEADAGVEVVRTVSMVIRREDAERVFKRWGELVTKGQVNFKTQP